MIQQGLAAAKAVHELHLVGQERKCEDRRRLDTVLFHALNDTISEEGITLVSRETVRFRVLGGV